MRIGFTFLLLGTIGISFAAIFVRLALPASPVVMGFYRMLFASVILGCLSLYWRFRSGAPEVAAHEDVSRRGLWLALLAGGCFGADLTLWQTGILETSVANATLLVNTTPIYVGIFSVTVLGQRLSRGFVFGAALAIFGCALLVGIEFDAPRALRGDILSLLAALFYSAYLLTMKSARRSVDVLLAVFIASLGATFVLGVNAFVLGHAFYGFPAHSWAAMLGAAVITQVGGVMAIVWSLRYLRTTFASVGLLAQPVGTALLGWWILDETIVPLQALGACILLAGVFLVSHDALDD